MKIILKLASKNERGKNQQIRWAVHDYPLGALLIAVDAEGLCWVGFADKKEWRQRFFDFFPAAAFTEDSKATTAIAKAITKSYPRLPENLPVPLVLYGTDFQIKVWTSLLKIQHGSVVTYGNIAARIAHPAAVRAVGSAVGRNPISVLVPCHRVVNRGDGRSSYGWGPDLKAALLKAEGAPI